MDDRPCTRPWHPEARRLAALGWTQRAIAAEVGQPRSSVAYFLNPYSHAARVEKERQRYRDDPHYRARKRHREPGEMAPLRLPMRLRRHCKPTQPWHIEAIRLCDAGKNCKEIGRLLGRNRSTVARFLDRDQYLLWRDVTLAKQRQRYREDKAFRERNKAKSLQRYHRSKERQAGASQAAHP